jgi:hypothetical protein
MHEPIQSAVRLIDTDVAGVLQAMGACTIGRICGLLPHYTWNQVFAVVDRLSREGAIVIKRHGRFDYLVSLSAQSSSATVDEDSPIESKRSCAV